MSRVEGKLREYFTDFDGRFDAQLGFVGVSQTAADEQLGTSSPYLCRVKIRYDRELMRLLDDGMLLAVRNFRSRPDSARYTLLEVVRFWPEHFGLSAVRDGQYYPIQFEVIQQSVEDWETDDKATMMVQLSAIPINYDLCFQPDGHCFERGFSYPIVGSDVYILNAGLINEMYNGKVIKKLGDCVPDQTSADARADPRLGTVKMFEAAGETIPFYIDFNDLVRYHFGIFAFTGGGKSNLLSNILRRLLVHNKDVKVIIFDISCEYPFLLMDVLSDPDIPSKIVFENEVNDTEDFYNSVVKPRLYEEDERVREGFKRIYDQGKVTFIRRGRLQTPQFSEFLTDIDTMKGENAKNPNYVEALRVVEEVVLSYMEEKGLREDELLTEELVERIITSAKIAAEEYKVHSMSALFGWFMSRPKMRDYFKLSRKGGKGCSVDDIEELLKGDTRLICLSISETTAIKQAAIDLTKNMLINRKREFTVRPYILFVFDEAQEFLSQPGNVRGVDKECSEEVERLLRQGRKYGLGGCIATQRIAYLNTNALQQLHTYFVSILPRPYDRGIVSNTFMIDKTILDKTLEFVPGEWLVSSYLATGMANVPIFMKADNAEDEIEKHLDK